MGNLKLALFLAYKSILKSNRWALLLIILVMSLSFANLLLTPSILSSMTSTMDQQQVDTLYADIVIDPAEDAYYIDRVGRAVNDIRLVPGVLAVSARLDDSAFMEYQWKDLSLIHI